MHPPRYQHAAAHRSRASPQVVPSSCRATVGQVAGGGRTEKPMLKAGRAYHKYRVKRNSWPKVGCPGDSGAVHAAACLRVVPLLWAVFGCSEQSKGGHVVYNSACCQLHVSCAATHPQVRSRSVAVALQHHPGTGRYSPAHVRTSHDAGYRHLRSHLHLTRPAGSWCGHEPRGASPRWWKPPAHWPRLHCAQVCSPRPEGRSHCCPPHWSPQGYHCGQGRQGVKRKKGRLAAAQAVAAAMLVLAVLQQGQWRWDGQCKGRRCSCCWPAGCGVGRLGWGRCCTVHGCTALPSCNG